MKQETEKKSKKLLWLIIALAVVVAVAGTLLGVFWSEIFGENPAGPANLPTELYWNVDRYTFVDEETGMSNRVPGDDGLFTIRYAYNGQIVELKVVGDKKLINFIDTMDVMGLVFDADGLVVDAVAAKEVVTEVVKDNYVGEVGKDYIRVNSAKTMSGMSTKVKLNEKTKIYDVSVGANPIGGEATFNQLDCVTVYADAEGNVLYIYITSRVETGDIYYIFDTQYDSVNKETKRVPDANGVYTFTAACEGALVELKVRDKDVMTSIDSASGLFGLKKDDEGYVIKKLEAASAMLGIKELANYTVTELNGDDFTLTRFMVGVEQGNTYSGTLTEDTDIFIVETFCGAEFVGQRTELKMGDRIDMWTDLEGNPKVMIITSRRVDSPLYWNIAMSYNWTTHETSRKPDENGYYNVSMVVDGKTVELRTKDKALMTLIDEKEEKAVGLKLKGNVIQAVYKCNCVTGLYAAGTNRYVTAISGNVIQISKTRDWTESSNYVVPKDCKVYDVSGYYGVERGSKATVRKFDCVTSFQNEANELTHIFITERYVEDAKIYYNYNRVTGRLDGITTRAKDEKGFYVFDMACEGKQVQVKTKDAELATYIDSQWPNYVALEVKKDGTIKNAYPARAAVKGGHERMRGNTVKAVNKDGTLENGYRNETTGIIGTSADLQMAEDCVVYNCSNGVTNFVGEKTQIKVGDQFSAIGAYPTGEIVQLFVMRRQVDSPLYWHYNKYSVTTNPDGSKQTTRPKDANGYYVFELIDNGKIVKLKTKDLALATQIDSNSQAFCLTQKNGIIQKFYGPTLASPDTTRYGIGGFDIMSMQTDPETKVTTAKAVRNRPQASDYGQTSDLVIRDDCRIICVDPNSPDFGKAVKLKLGDRVVNYRDPEGRTTYIFIQTRNTHKEGHISHCDHCDKEVFWEPLLNEFSRDDTYAKTTTFHYYLPYDLTSSYAIVVGYGPVDQTNYQIVLDLNGKTVTGTKQAFTVYSGDELTILDTVGGGKVESMIASGSEAGCIFVQGTLNLLSGTIQPAAGAAIRATAGVVGVNGGTFNMKGGLVTGGKVNGKNTYGGNIQVTSGGVFNMYGGTVSNGVAELDPTQGGSEANGGNISITSGGSANIYGGTITGGHAKEGGNIYLGVSGSQVSTLKVEGGTITGGIATGRGGNIYVNNDGGAAANATLTATGGLITKGEAAQGGNIYIRHASLNLGGTVTEGKSPSGANVKVYTNKTLPLNFTGKIGAAAADSGDQNTVVLTCASVDMVVTFNGATIEGPITTQKNAAVTMSGKLNLNRITVPSGLKLTLDDLAADSVIGVSAEGVFTQDNDNTETYKAYFKPTGRGDKIEFTDANKKSLTYIPLDGFDNSNLEFEAGKAWCPKCEQEVVWTALNKTANNAIGAGHYYLDDNAGFSGGSFITKNAAGTLCIHLNGKNVEMTGGASFLNFTAAGVVNVMGNGNVATTTDGGTLLNMGYDGTATLYGGNYFNKGTGPVALMYTSTLNINEGVTFGTDTAGTTVYSNPIKVEGGASVLNVNGGVIEAINFNNGALTLAGKPTIKNLSVATGKAVTLGALKTGADIKVNAAGAFTVANNNAGTYSSFLKPFDAENKVINLKTDNIFYCEDKVIAPPANVDYAAKLTTETGTVTAWCAACGQNVSWCPIGNYDPSVYMTNWSNSHNHFYLTKSITKNRSGEAIMQTNGIGKVCFHLNGFDITNDNYSVFAVTNATDTLNILGSGNVRGNGTYGATIYAKGNLNLYAGTYKKHANATGTTANVIRINAADAVVSIYKDVLIDDPATDITNGNQASVYSDKAVVYNIYGGTIRGTLSATTATAVNVSGAPVIGRLNLASGKKINVGEMTEGASIGLNKSVTGTDLTFSNAPAAYAPYFHAVSAGDAVIPAKDGKLTYASATIQWTNESEKKAICPVCNTEQKWYGIDNTTSWVIGNAAVNSTHFYLTANRTKVTGVGNGLTTDSNHNEICLYLNGKNITATADRAIAVMPNSGDAVETLNVIGGGLVSGGKFNVVNVRNNKAVLNLYGGTYSVAAGASNTEIPVINNGGGILRIYQGVTVNATNCTTSNVVNLDGGTNEIHGGTFNCRVRANSNVTISGTPKIQELFVPEAKDITLGTLTTGANIKVSGAGVFTVANEKAPNYVAYFTGFAINDTVELVVEDNTLKHVAAPAAG